MKVKRAWFKFDVVNIYGNTLRFVSKLPFLALFEFLFSQALEEKDRKQSVMKDQLSREQRRLRQRLDLLKTMAYRKSRGGRTISECSSSTVSTASTASISNDEPGKCEKKHPSASLMRGVAEPCTDINIELCTSDHTMCQPLRNTYLLTSLLLLPLHDNYYIYSHQ